jgi:hypothetical protein
MARQVVKIEVVVEIAYYLTIRRSDRIRAGGQIYFVFKPAGPMIWNEKSLHLTKPAEFIWPDLP